MGFYVRKRIRTGKNSWINVSKRGASFSERVGPVTFNSRGRTTVRLGKGLTYRGGCLVALAVPLSLAATGTLAALMALTHRL